MSKVLILDDDKQIGDVLSIILRTAGYDLLAITDTDDILALVKSTAPDLIVLDIRLQGKDGRDYASLLKNDPATRSIPIILISARVGNLSGDELRGADLYLAKPFRMRELLEHIQDLLPHSPPQP